MAGVDSLLSSFPAPPTFIPASPLPYDRDSYNLDEEDERDEFPFPGIMGPPRVPLPALPGGANELDALMSICNSPAPSRRTSVASWRFSRLSDTTVFVKSDHMAPLQPRSSISLPDESSPPTPTAPRPPRSASPDVAELLATTPRPLVRRLNTLSLTSSASTSSTSSLINQDDDYSSSQSDGEHSDSSIDIATPLPNLMVRAGLLSPHSKILIPPGALPAPKVRGAPKDARDTQRRRNRHRDGRLLREGVGLTTGLGWSDSEDEDAPSALTHRLSTVDLSRRGSMMSLGNRSRSHSEYSPSPVGNPRSNFELIKDRSPLSRTMSNSSAATFGTGSAVNVRGGTGAELNRQPRVRQRTTSEGASVHSAGSIVGAYMSDSEHTPEPMPALPALPPKHQHMPSSQSAGSIARSTGLRKATSAYPLARSFSIDNELGGAGANSTPYGSLRPLSPSSLLGEKPLPQLPLLENPPPRSDSRGAIRQRTKTSAPPSAFGGISASNRPRTSSTSSATSASSIDSVIHASMSAGFDPVASAASRPGMMRQTSAPLRRPNAAVSSSIGKGTGSAMPQLRKRPSLLALSQTPPNPSVVAVGSSPLPSPSSTPTPTSASSVVTPISSSPLPLDPETTPTPERRTFSEGIPRSKPYSARSPSAPRTLRLGTPQSRMAPPRASLGASFASSVPVAAPTTTALPVPRGRTTSGPRTGAGMTYRSSGISLGRA